MGTGNSLKSMMQLREHRQNTHGIFLVNDPNAQVANRLRVKLGHLRGSFSPAC
uniref:Vesicle transport protein GOT1B isoform X1 n=1 Tax=Rhizophora mucronata TaxID=61149 RepID=A0A2P2K6S1_RHIMU